MAPADRESEASGSSRQELWRLSGLGAEFTGVVAGLTIIGHLLDRWLGTLPWMTVGGAALGMGAGGYKFIREALRASRRANEAYRRAHPHGSEPDADR